MPSVVTGKNDLSDRHWGVVTFGGGAALECLFRERTQSGGGMRPRVDFL